MMTLLPWPGEEEPSAAPVAPWPGEEELLLGLGKRGHLQRLGLLREWLWRRRRRRREEEMRV